MNNILFGGLIRVERCVSDLQRHDDTIPRSLNIYISFCYSIHVEEHAANGRL